MLRQSQKSFLLYLEKTYDEKSLFACRLICRIWNNYIQSRPLIKEWIIKQREMRKLLAYDEKIYDENSYKRMIIKNILNPREKVYKQLVVPNIQISASDLDEDENMVCVLYGSLPLDLRIFLCEYFRSPNVVVRLYSPEFFRSISDIQSSFLRAHLIDGESLENIILFSPICYSKHYRKRSKDQQHMNVLCYINIIDEKVGLNFPSEDERYIVFELPLEDLKDEKNHHDLLKSFLLEKSQELCRVPETLDEISQNVRCINDGFITLLQNHHYNL
jgi:hypothetical protein